MPKRKQDSSIVYACELTGNGDYGALAAEEYGVEKALSELIRAQKRDVKFPRTNLKDKDKLKRHHIYHKNELSRVEWLSKKWDDDFNFVFSYKKIEFDTHSDMCKAIDMANSVPMDYDQSKHSNTSYITDFTAPEVGTLSDTDVDEDDDDDDDEN